MLNKDHPDDNLEITVSCRVFPEEYKALRAIVKCDPDVFDMSHAVRIAVKQFVFKRIKELEEKGITVIDDRGDF